MITIQRLFVPKNKTNSLFTKLVISFLFIIIFLVALNYLTISLMSAEIRREIVSYNSANLERTADNYEKHFELVRKSMMSSFINENVQQFGTSNNFIKYPSIQAELKRLVANPLLMLDDIFLYSELDGRILDYRKSSPADTMFSVFLTHEKYTEAFWKDQFSENYSYKVLPEAEFHDYTYVNMPANTLVYLPVVYKGYSDSPFYMAGLLDSQKMFEQLQISVHDNLIIMNNEQMLYSKSLSPSIQPSSQELLLKDEVFHIYESYYYFYKQGKGTGFTYISVVPVEKISAQLKIKSVLLVVLIVSILIAIAFVVWFVRKINNPLQQIIESLLNQNKKLPASSRIKEFDEISEQFRSLSSAKEQADYELQSQKSLLQSFAYVNQVKDITQKNGSEVTFANNPFILILFHLTIRGSPEHMVKEESRWYAYVKEFIDLTVSHEHKQSISFHIEKNQLMNIIFCKSVEEVMPVLNKIKNTLDIDKSFGFATISASSVYNHSDELTDAYEETLKRLEMRPLQADTRIIKEDIKCSGAYHAASSDQMREFNTQLLAGNFTSVQQLINKLLGRLNEQQCSATEAVRTAKLLLDRGTSLLNSVATASGDELTYIRAESALENCSTYEELESSLLSFLRQLYEQVEKHKQQIQTDKIIDFVLKYVEANYSKAFYLEDLAGELKITSGYLSTYFKEKTGSNFVDYLNQVRVEKACGLLQTTELKAREIAERVGYQNINSFNRMFKKYTGITPTEYRQQQKSIT